MGRRTYDNTFETTCKARCQGLCSRCHPISFGIQTRPGMMKGGNTYIACLGLFLLWVMRRLFWYSSSKVAAERPLPTLLVNFVRLSEKPNTVFFTKLAAPCRVIRS